MLSCGVGIWVWEESKLIGSHGWMVGWQRFVVALRWWCYFQGRIGWSADCRFWVAGAGVCWGGGIGNCACWAMLEWALKLADWMPGVVVIKVVVGRRVGKAVGLACSSVMHLKSSWIVHQGCGAWTGTYLLRNFRLQRVILLDPSTRTTY